jgi:hypothetical protein
MLQAILPLIGPVLDKIIPDKAGAEKAKQEIEKTLINNAQELLRVQAETNKVEASHRSLFVAGWRPMIGWSCSIGFFWLFIGHPIAEWIAHLQGIQTTFPEINTDILMELTFGMLGLAGLRTYEKQKGISK